MIIIKAAKPLALLLIATQITTLMSADVMAAQAYEKLPVTTSGELVIIDKGSGDVGLLDSDENEISTVSLDLPSSYNSDINALKYVTPVKNQEDLGVCWSFSAASAIETLLMKKDGVDKVTESNKDNYDLSEMHMAYALSNKMKKDGYGMEPAIENGGGNTAFAASYFTRERNAEEKIYNGPAYEKDFPYKGDKTALYTDDEVYEKIEAEPINMMPSSYFSFQTVQTYLDDARKDKRNEIIKKALIEHGSVSLSITSGTNMYIPNKAGDKTLYYDNDPTRMPNHGVTVVGYDDNFSASEFEVFDYAEGDGKYPAKPTHDGAFIVKNSWGEKWGLNNGFFYMSYDSDIAEVAAFGDLIERNGDYTKIYDYTPTGTPGVVGYGNYYEDGEFSTRPGAATTFNRENPDTEETLKKIGVWTIRDNTYIKLYADTDAGTIDLSADQAPNTAYDDFEYAPIKPINENTVKEGDYIRIEKSGYYIFDLETPLKLTGDSFTISCEYALKDAGQDPDDPTFVDEPSVCYECSKPGIVTLNENDGLTFEYDFVNNRYIRKQPYDLLLKGFTEEKVKVTVNDSEEITLPVNGILDNGRTLYKKVGENTYAEFDKQTPLTGNTALYTADKIGAADITLTQQDGVKDGSYVGTRIVGEIAKDAGNAKEVKAIGFTAYKDDKETAIDGKTEYSFEELYEEIEGYQKKAPDSYIFKTPVMDKKDVDSVTFFGKFIHQDNTEITVNYINRKLRDNGEE